MGIADIDLFDYERVLGVKFTSTRAEPRLDWRERNIMTHAVAITAVCFDADGRPVRYKVVNLRGEGAGDQGFSL